MHIVYIISVGSESLRVPLTASCSLWKNFGIRSRIALIKKNPHGHSEIRLYMEGKKFPGMFRKVLLVTSEEAKTTEFCWGDVIPDREEILILVNRLRDPRDYLFLERIYRAVSFLFGLSIGLERCRKDRCVMSLSPEELDKQEFELCDKCKKRASEKLRGGAS